MNRIDPRAANRANAAGAQVGNHRNGLQVAQRRIAVITVGASSVGGFGSAQAHAGGDGIAAQGETADGGQGKQAAVRGHWLAGAVRSLSSPVPPGAPSRPRLVTVNDWPSGETVYCTGRPQGSFRS